MLSACPFALIWYLLIICLFGSFLYGGFAHNMSVCLCMTFTVYIFAISNSLYVVEIEFSMIYQIFWEKKTLWKKLQSLWKNLHRHEKDPPNFGLPSANLQGVFYMTSTNASTVWNAIKWWGFVQFLQLAQGLFLRLCGFKIILFCPMYAGRFTYMLRSLKWGLYVILVFWTFLLSYAVTVCFIVNELLMIKTPVSTYFCRRKLGHSQNVHISQSRWKMRLSLLIIDQKIWKMT